MLKKVIVFMGFLYMGFGFAGTTHHEVNADDSKSLNASTNHLLYPIEQKGKFGFINSNGEVIVEPIYENLVYPGLASTTYYIVDHTNNKQVYYNSAGNKLFECLKNKCGPLYEGRALFMDESRTPDGTRVTRYGYLNEQGEVAIKPIYHKAFNFSEGLARVNQGKASGFINTKGELVIPYRYSETFDFSEGKAVVKLSAKGKYGYIDTSGKMVISPQFDYAKQFSEDTAVVSVNGKYGYINSKGDYLLKPQFTNAQPFSEGLAFVERNGASFYINKKGEKIIQFIKAGGTFSGGLAPASRGRTYGFIDKSGFFVIKPQFEWADSFYGDLAKVYLHTAISEDYIEGYIDRRGNILWPPKQR
ncbi:WG repeat-containing protein [Paenibacillus solani]|uniref:WG repeat-containing protein n=1 Tax=Paenibacillus solani TaxID=1705565 RepID=UPI003D2BD526